MTLRDGYGDRVHRLLHAPRRALLVALAVYLACVVRVTLWPEPAPDEAFGVVRTVLAWLQGRGVAVTYAGVEAVANVVMFVPFGLLVALLLRRPWLTVALGALTSTAIEVAQLAFLPTRVPTVQDVAMNTVGTALGVGALALARRRAGRDLPTETPARVGA
ncbi:VanZ family protein [Cellulomonas fimi ATCC 484]|uniref:VanZ family protein n=1 Tax=Cellulomonas fimi (strain ATCC 484 / DSM 20113 / JCM 1341 / CCUG 24087 / LMG 16345 / NBRC 15513 / NCIMB 8980 / NCTC 7547 / NRS-133) TaxID=590998 RepID=F4GZD6_CELFA|nr:VanZ family protein [Cellulomonas fimi ATCC 484]VEH27499.1 Predicted integral membrane protein [Cellulomonas fimi]